MTKSPNILALEAVVHALGGLQNEMVFTGGAVVELYEQKGSGIRPRVTKDVDSIVPTATIAEYHALEAKLHKRGFINAGLVGEKGPTCRYKLNDIIFDIMPSDEKVLGFSNRWFKHALENPFIYALPSKETIRLATFPRFLAIKFETLHDRGGKDIRGSHDLEDIVRLVDGRLDPLAELSRESEEVSSFIRDSVKKLLSNELSREAIETSSQLGFEQAERVISVFDQLSLERG